MAVPNALQIDAVRVWNTGPISGGEPSQLIYAHVEQHVHLARCMLTVTQVFGPHPVPRTQGVTVDTSATLTQHADLSKLHAFPAYDFEDGNQYFYSSKRNDQATTKQVTGSNKLVKAELDTSAGNLDLYLPQTPAFLSTYNAISQKILGCGGVAA